MEPVTLKNVKPHFYTLSFDTGQLLALQRLFDRQVRSYLTQNPELLSGGTTHCFALPSGDFSLFSYNRAPLLWIAANNNRCRGLFQSFFDTLAPNLQELLQARLHIKKGLQLYSGFFVVGNQATEALWHADYLSNANAYTLLTPLFDLKAEHGQLLYQFNEKPLRYVYKLGEAVCVGQDLLHATEPYSKTKDLRVLLSLTFGGDDMAYWRHLKPVLISQSSFYMRPCGHSSKTKCLCFLTHKR